MLAAAFIAGMVLSFALAWQGLFGPGLKVTKDYTLEGTGAKVLGIICGLFGLSLLAGVVWVVMSLSK